MQRRESVRLGTFIDDYLSQRTDVKHGTMLVMRQARRNVTKFLGETTQLNHVTPADADAYRADLLGRGRAQATVAKWCWYARHFFEVAKRRKLIIENPFAHIKGTVLGEAANATGAVHHSGWTDALAQAVAEPSRITGDRVG